MYDVEAGGDAAAGACKINLHDTKFAEDTRSLTPDSLVTHSVRRAPRRHAAARRRPLRRRPALGYSLPTETAVRDSAAHDEYWLDCTTAVARQVQFGASQSLSAPLHLAS